MAVLLAAATPAAVAQTLNGNVEQNGTGPGSPEIFNSQSRDAPTPNSTGIDIRRCQSETIALQAPPPPGWGPPQHVNATEMTSKPSGYWARCAVDACHPGDAVCWRALDYGPPPPGQTGYYPGFTANTAGPQNWTPPSDSKGVFLEPNPQSPALQNPVSQNPASQGPPPQSGDLAILQAMDDCLVSGIPGGVSDNLARYYRPPLFRTTAAASPPVAYAPGTVFYNPARLDALAAQGHSYQRADLLASALAEHVFALRKAAFPAVTRSQGALIIERDNIIGFLNACLQAKQLVPPTQNMDPHDPRIEFMALVPKPYAEAEEGEFKHGRSGFLEYSIMLIRQFDRYDRLDLAPTGGVYPPGGGLLVPD